MHPLKKKSVYEIYLTS